MNNLETTSLDLEVVLDLGARTPADSLDEQTRDLRDELEGMGLARALLPAISAPPGAKGAGTALLGKLLVRVAPSALPRLIQFFRSWLGRSARRRLKVRGRNGDRTFELDLDASGLDGSDLAKMLTIVAPSLTQPTKSVG